MHGETRSLRERIAKDTRGGEGDAAPNALLYLFSAHAPRVRLTRCMCRAELEHGGRRSGRAREGRAEPGGAYAAICREGGRRSVPLTG